MVDFFEEQKRLYGAAGHSAVRLEILLILIVLISWIGFLDYTAWSIIQCLISLVIPGLGFYGALKLRDQYLQIYVILSIISVVFGGIVLLLWFIALGSYKTVYCGYSSSVSDCIDAPVSLGVYVFITIFEFVSILLRITSIVWAQRLRGLIRLAKHSQPDFQPVFQPEAGYAAQPAYPQPGYAQPGYAQPAAGYAPQPGYGAVPAGYVAPTYNPPQPSSDGYNAPQPAGYNAPQPGYSAEAPAGYPQAGYQPAYTQPYPQQPPQPQPQP